VLGRCIRCGGEIEFGEKADARKLRDQPIAPGTAPYQALGPPRLPG
jgi:hypothetical protein